VQLLSLKQELGVKFGAKAKLTEDQIIDLKDKRAKVI